MSKNKIGKNVIVSFRIINVPGIETFAGAIKGLRTLAKWHVNLFAEPKRLSLDDLTQSGKSIDGILINHPLQEDLTNAFLNSTIPLVVLGNTDQRFFRRRTNVAFIESDNRKIGEMAANYFLSLGKFRTYAFMPDSPSSRWSRMRLRGFRVRLMSSHIEVNVFDGGSLSNWLSSLKKPVALFLAGDYLASDAMSACLVNGLDIPEDVSILGVDNNPILCESVPVPLSSIEPSFSKGGFESVRILDKIIRAKKQTDRPIIFRTPPIRVVERASTTRTRPSAELVERAVHFVNANVEHGITAGLVAKHLGVSSQLLALRFAQLEHTSVRAYIINARLAKVKKMLRTTRLPIQTIATQCGFRTGNHLEHLFAKHVGISPGKWRRKNVEIASCLADRSSKRKKCKRKER